MITVHRKVDSKPIFIQHEQIVMVESRINETINDPGCFVWMRSGTNDKSLLREVMESTGEVRQMIIDAKKENK